MIKLKYQYFQINQWNYNWSKTKFSCRDTFVMLDKDGDGTIDIKGNSTEMRKNNYIYVSDFFISQMIFVTRCARKIFVFFCFANTRNLTKRRLVINNLYFSCTIFEHSRTMALRCVKLRPGGLHDPFAVQLILHYIILLFHWFERRNIDLIFLVL